MKSKIIKVKTKSKNYEVHIGTNLISKLGNILKKNKIKVILKIILLDCFKIFILQNHFNFFVGGWEINLAQNNNRQNQYKKNNYSFNCKFHIMLYFFVV